MSAAKTRAQKLIDDNSVVVFSKSYCPYCTASKKKLDGLNAKYTLLELDQEEEGSAIQTALAEISGQRTVPNIFIQQKHLGGNSDLQAKEDLREVLVAAGAITE